MAALDTFIGLRNYTRGKIDKYELEDSDELISEVKEDRSNRGQSIVVVDFDDENKFLETIGLSEDDAWFYKVVTSYYSDYEFMDQYSVNDDFKNGYGVWYVFDEENIDLLKKISKIIYSKPFDIEDSDFKEGFAEKLLTNFKSEIEDILSDYQSEKNSEMQNVAHHKVKKEVNEYLERLGFELYGDGFKTTVANLMMLYLKENSIHLSLEEFLKKILDGDKYGLGGWYENSYEFQNDEYFNKSSFNSYASKKLNDILEKLENSEEGATVQEYTQMTDRITKKFKEDKFYKLPKDPKKEIRFKIDGFEYPAMKVIVILQKGFKQKKIKVSEQNFYNLLYQPSLFNLEEI